MLVERTTDTRPDTRNHVQTQKMSGHRMNDVPTRHAVDEMERCGNRRPRVQKLVSAWNQGVRGDDDPEGEADDALIGASTEPSKRPRTRLTDGEVDAMRTAREQGVSVNTLAKQFGVHRGTVWVKTR